MGLSREPVAGAAGDLPHVPLEALARGVGLGLGVASLHVGDDALEAWRSTTAAARSGSCSGRAPARRRRAAPPVRTLTGSLPKGLSMSKPISSASDSSSRVKYWLVCAPGPRRDRPLGQRLAGVGDEQLLVDLHLGAEPVAVRTGAVGAVEREGARLELVEGQPVAGAGQVLGEGALAVGVVLREVDEVEHDQATGEPECGLDRVGEPLPGRRLHRQPVDDHLDGVLLLLVELGHLTERVHRAVDAGARVALCLQLPEEVEVLPLAATRRREPAPGSASPASRARTWSTICWGVCRAIGSPQTGQCG